MERNEIPEKDRWNLEKMYLDRAAWDKDFEEAAKLMEELPQYPGTVTDSAERLYEYLQLDQKLGMKLDKLFVYAKMKLDEDNRQNVYQAMQD
ncbi:MAG: oligoendopeptidase F, partial [Bacillota bacterium]|nr:oligoendopeptidase F [Bacillota bacterium]